MPGRSNSRTSLCRFDDIEEGAARGFELAEGASTAQVFIIRQGMKVYAYRNSCPHTGVNLEWLPDQFLDSSGQYIQCAVHGAIFRIEDGQCVRGPCVDQRLMAIPVFVQDGDVICDLSSCLLADG